MSRLLIPWALLAGAPAALADRGAIRGPLELDSEGWHYAEPFWLRLGLRSDVYLVSLSDGAAAEYDLRGRQQRMRYAFDPVGVLTGTVDFAWRHSPTADPVRAHFSYGLGMGLGAGDGGEGDAGPLQAVGVSDGALTMLAEAMLSYAGVIGFVSYSRFEDGEITVEGGPDAGTTRFTLERLVGRAGYEFAPFEQFVEVDGAWRTVRPFGFTVFLQAQRYSAPRIVYRVVKAPAEADAEFVYAGELPPQIVSLESLSLGGSAILMVGRSDDLRTTLHLELGGAIGPGRTDLDLGTGQQAVPLWAGSGTVSVLGTHRIPIEGTGLLELSAQYTLELVDHWLRDASDDTYLIGGLDLFHGPRLEVVLRM